MGEIMYESMWKVNFKGIKGDVYFDRETGSAPGTILIQQIQGIHISTRSQTKLANNLSKNIIIGTKAKCLSLNID